MKMEGANDSEGCAERREAKEKRKREEKRNTLVVKEETEDAEL